MAVKYPGVAYRLGTWFGSVSLSIHDGNSQSPEPLVMQAFAGFFRAAKPGKKPL